MADVNLPNFSELGQMEFMAPMAFQQAQNQIGLANQFQQQNLATGEQDLQQKTLANIYSSQADPLRLQQLGLTNQGLANTNASTGVKARQDLALEPEARAAKRAELLQKASEDELKQLMSTAEKEYMSDDPVVSKRAENKLLHTKAELTRRNAAADALERAQASAEARLQGIQEAQAGMTARNTANIQSRESIASKKEAALQAKAQGNPKTAEAAAVRFQMEADLEDDPAEKARLAQLAKQYGAYSMALKNAQAGTKPDMAQFGFTTNPVNMGVGGVNPAPTRPAASGSGLAGGGANDVQNILLQEYKNATDPRDREAVARELQRAGYRGALPGQQPSGQPTQAPAGPANVPKAPAGRVVIYKDGKAIGSVPESQVEAAKQQGYSVK